VGGIQKSAVAADCDHQIDIGDPVVQFCSGNGFEFNSATGQLLLEMRKRLHVLFVSDFHPRDDVTAFFKELQEARLPVFDGLNLEGRLFVKDEDLADLQFLGLIERKPDGMNATV
jgi:hypothetical protein